MNISTSHKTRALQTLARSHESHRDGRLISTNLGMGAGCATQERIKEQQHHWSKVLLGQEPGLPSKSRQDISLIRGVELSSLACHVESTNGSPDYITGLDPRVGKRPESGQHRHYLGELLRTGCY